MPWNIRTQDPQTGQKATVEKLDGLNGAKKCARELADQAPNATVWVEGETGRIPAVYHYVKPTGDKAVV